MAGNFSLGPRGWGECGDRQPASAPTPAPGLTSSPTWVCEPPWEGRWHCSCTTGLHMGSDRWPRGSPVTLSSAQKGHGQHAPLPTSWGTPPRSVGTGEYSYGAAPAGTPDPRAPSTEPQTRAETGEGGQGSGRVAGAGGDWGLLQARARRGWAVGDPGGPEEGASTTLPALQAPQWSLGTGQGGERSPMAQPLWGPGWQTREGLRREAQSTGAQGAEGTASGGWRAPCHSREGWRKAGEGKTLGRAHGGGKLQDLVRGPAFVKLRLWAKRCQPLCLCGPGQWSQGSPWPTEKRPPWH